MCSSDLFQGGQICYSGLVNITSTSNFRDYALSCTSSGPIALNLNQGIAIEIWGTSPNITDTYSISTGDDSREIGRASCRERV